MFLFVSQKFYKFASPYDLEECVRLLQEKGSPRGWFKSVLVVKLQQIDDQAYRFNLYKRVGRGLKVQFTGELRQVWEERTQVTARATISPDTYLGLIILLAFFIALSSATDVPAAGIFAALFCLILLFSTASEMDDLARSMIYTLADPSLEPKHAQILPAKSQVTLFEKLLPYVIFLLLFVAIWENFTGSIGKRFDSCVFEPAEARPVLDSTITITPRWAAQIPVILSSDRANLFIDDSALIALTCGPQITSFKLTNGNVNWKVQNIGDQMAVDAQRDSIYARQRLWGITALSLSSGTVLWRNSAPPIFERAIPNLYLTPQNQLLIHNWKGIWNINAENGAAEDDAFAALPGWPFLLLDDIGLSIEARNMIATERVNGQRLWATPIQRDYVNTPLLIKNTLLFLEDVRLSALDLETGNILWTLHNHRIRSNLASNDSLVFALNETAKLLIINLENGAIQESVQFELPDNQLNDNGEPALSRSKVAVNDNTVAIYFSDTENLNVIQLE